jgi:hypothetical protein
MQTLQPNFGLELKERFRTYTKQHSGSNFQINLEINNIVFPVKIPDHVISLPTI